MIIKINPDREKASSILQMVELREKFLKSLENKKANTTIIAENYYEIIKELCNAIGLAKGYKSIGTYAHKEIINLIGENKEFDESDIETMQDLRARRNKSSYEGKLIEEVYLENKEKDLLSIIKKLKNLLQKLID